MDTWGFKEGTFLFVTLPKEYCDALETLLGIDLKNDGTNSDLVKGMESDYPNLF